MYTPSQIRLFADVADIEQIRRLARHPLIAGFTTNPTLMRRAGVSDYSDFAKAVLAELDQHVVCFEVVADDFAEMEEQARRIAEWGPSVYVKIPITNTRGERSAELIRRLSADGICVNVTAVLCLDQVRDAAAALGGSQAAIISIFAGRIADTGRDPIPLIREALGLLASCPQVQLMWASSRELFNLVQADRIGCPLITLPPALLGKIPMLGRTLEDLSVETVRMFYDDAARAGYML
ncbi:transaldolase [Rhodococcus sp. T7]|uniref:transaldolase n=1 Tax=Rhodococcus sp. T7 TaxID=627444 RepID=UPI00135935C9|nr:transaldolase [Rhodococcus sp. T7]KAF0957323.1 Transaldolase [Rhodococcus sp. T7]KAF0959184.1 Transaldolase [Rhodococcus sp. T7]